ncbi:MAG: hypothetical protein QXO07_01255 [Candidatus Aenigmatarchaeota archaeon]
MIFDFKKEEKEEELAEKKEVFIPAKATDILDINFELLQIEASLKSGELIYDSNKKSWILKPGPKESWFLNDLGIQKIKSIFRSFLIPKIHSISILDDTEIGNLAFEFYFHVLIHLYENYKDYEIKKYSDVFLVAWSLFEKYMLILKRSKQGIGFMKLGYVPSTQ